MVFLVVLGRVELINRVVHTEKVVRILSKLYPNITVIVEDVCPWLKEYFNEQVAKYSRVIYLKEHKLNSIQALQRIPLAMLRNFFASLVIVAIMSKNIKGDLRDDKIAFIKGFNVSLALLLKLLGYKTVLFAGGFGSAVSDGIKKRWLLFKEVVLCRAVDKIIIETPAVTIYYRFLRSYMQKLFPYGALYVNDEFRIIKPFKKRGPIIGYVGALVPNKGIMQLILAMNIMAKLHNELMLYVIGDGPLKSQLEKMVRDLSLRDRVSFLGMVPHSRLPHYLNEMRLLVLPSVGEGLPNIILEAMACGTPVMATPVGGITDIIKEGFTGFLLKSVEPNHIASRILEVINNELALLKVIDNALKLVSENFTFSAAVRRWHFIRENINVDE